MKFLWGDFLDQLSYISVQPFRSSDLDIKPYFDNNYKHGIYVNIFKSNTRKTHPLVEYDKVQITRHSSWGGIERMMSLYVTITDMLRRVHYWIDTGRQSDEKVVQIGHLVQIWPTESSVSTEMKAITFCLNDKYVGHKGCV